MSDQQHAPTPTTTPAPVTPDASSVPEVTLETISRACAPWLWQPGPRPAWWIAAGAAAIYLLTWGLGTIQAVMYLVGAWPMLTTTTCVTGSPTHGCQPPSDVRVVLGPMWPQVSSNVWVLLGCLLLLAALGLPRQAVSWPTSWTAWVQESWAGVGWWLGFSLIELASSLTPGGTYPLSLPRTPVEAHVLLWRMSLGGAVEEVWFGPVLVTILRRYRAPWWAIVLVAGILRGVFHVYYGAPVWGHALWGATAALVYLATGRWLIPFILHALQDLYAAAAGAHMTGLATTVDSVRYLLIFALILTVLVWVGRYRYTLCAARRRASTGPEKGVSVTGDTMTSTTADAPTQAARHEQ